MRVEQQKTVWRCDECGGTNVEFTAWVRPNDGWAVTEFVEDPRYPGTGDTWCHDCDEHTALTDEVTTEFIDA